MRAIDLLKKQTAGNYEWCNKLLASTAFEKWNVIPSTVESSLAWQAGHLIMSNYFLTMVIAGHQKDLFQHIPFKIYDELFTDGLPANALGRVSPDQLFQHLKLVQQRSIERIDALSDSDLIQPLEPAKITHPIAKTKSEAIEWNIQHTMYHCGQIGLLKRVVDERFDFGFRR